MCQPALECMLARLTNARRAPPRTPRWLMSRRARDMGLISQEGAFNLDTLAWINFMRQMWVRR